MLRICLISDTHGLLRPEAETLLHGCHRIVHAGDIGHAGILERLAAIAPVTAVRGNNDLGAWADQVRENELLDIGGKRLYVIHDLAQLDIDAAAMGIDVVVSGHSHKPSIVERQGVLFVNPGSAGPRRFKLPASIAELTITNDGEIAVRTLELPLAVR